MNLSNKQSILIGAAVVVAAGLAWYFFGSSSGTQAPLTAGSGGTPNPVETQFLTLTSELTPISFSPAIFTDPRFTELVDISTQVTSEPVGRTDPFAPANTAAASSNTASSGSAATSGSTGI